MRCPDSDRRSDQTVTKLVGLYGRQVIVQVRGTCSKPSVRAVSGGWSYGEYGVQEAGKVGCPWRGQVVEGDRLAGLSSIYSG